TTFALVYPPPDPGSQFNEDTRAVHAAEKVTRASSVDGAPVHLTGFDVLSDQSGGDGRPRGLAAAPVRGRRARIIPAFVFASFLAVVPLMTAVVSIMTTFLLLFGLTRFADVSPIVQFLVALVGLGVAIDYSLLVVTRWREERSHGHEGDEAVQRA